MSQMPSSDSAVPLSESDHINMDAFLGFVLEDFASGLLSKDDAIANIAHVMTALATGNVSEARNWFAQGRKFIRREQ